MKPSCSTLLVAVLLFVTAADLGAQKKKKKPGSDDEGYIPVVAPENPKDKKKKNENNTQTLPPPAELPLTIAAETDRLAFAVSPLSAKGLLSQQTREALNGLLHRNHGTIVKLRAFVAGSGDLRRVGELTGEIFTDKHEPLPVLSVVQVGALPLQGAQVVIESTELDRKPVNPNGIAFFSAQTASSVRESLDNLKRVLAKTGSEPGDVLRVTCFVSSLDEQAAGDALMTATFPNAAPNYLQMQREPVRPGAECEMVARLRAPPPAAAGVPDLEIALVTSPKIVITGTQLAFGNQESDLKLAFDRLEKALSASNTSFNRVVMSHLYVTSGTLSDRMQAVQAKYSNGPRTLLPVEGLPALDSGFGVDVIAAAER